MRAAACQSINDVGLREVVFSHMRRFLSLILLFVSGVAFAQLPKTPDGTKQPRILILLDGSSSMLSQWDSKMPRFRAAGNIVADLMDSVYKVNNQVEFGLRVYGHQFPAQQNNCTDTKREVMFSKDNYTQMGLRIASLNPSGVSPMAYALREAATIDLDDEIRNAYSIILISDGGESCNGNVCEVVKNLLQRKIFFKSYVISLVKGGAEEYRYQCLGENLLVDNTAAITPAIQRIMKDYTPMLREPILTASKPEEPAKPKPPVDIRKIAIPRSLSERSSFQSLPVTIQAKMPKTVHYNPAIKRMRRADLQFAAIVVPPEPVVVTPPPVPVPPPVVVAPPKERVNFPTLSPMAARSRFPRTVHYTPVLRNPRRTDLAVATIVVPPEPVVEKPREKLDVPTLAIARRVKLPETFHYNPVMRKRRKADLAFAKIEVPPAPVVAPPVVVTPPVEKPVEKPVEEKTSVSIKPLPVAVAKPLPKPDKKDNKPSSIKFTASAEDAKATTAQIYFTDGHGKFYKTTPRLQLINSEGLAIKSFFRTIDASGNPDPIELPTGRYSIAVPGRAKAVMYNIEITAGKNHKFVAVVNNGSLIFRYEGAPERPISEFDAIVNILFEPGPTVKQRCTAELEYAPGNYHVEVNTLPITRYNVDIDFGNTTILALKQPGTLQFTNTNPIGKISLYHPLGDQYLRFYMMELNGKPESQKLLLQPGTYEVHWVKNPAVPFGTETVQRFRVLSNSVTEIDLH